MIQTNSKKKYVNIMEEMVAQEVNRKMTLLPEKLTKYIKRADVETYALNRLPPLYASSKEGLQFQIKKAQKDYEKKIAMVVSHAFAAVQKDILRKSTPLFKEEIKKVASATATATSESQKSANQNYSSRHSHYYRPGCAR
ncbi:late competence development ComFB family protein [Dapis sp. BLCC M172]|uniref:late competence development ComFB family protein n=1 Tax=Dapis sp. BLCC M172 TaxID=2975281 RepID=UPI003CF52D3C